MAVLTMCWTKCLTDYGDAVSVGSLSLGVVLASKAYTYASSMLESHLKDCRMNLEYVEWRLHDLTGTRRQREEISALAEQGRCRGFEEIKQNYLRLSDKCLKLCEQYAQSSFWERHVPVSQLAADIENLGQQTVALMKDILDVGQNTTRHSVFSEIVKLLQARCDQVEHQPPSLPTSAGGTEKRQCSTMTTAGKRCRNRAKVPAAQAHMDGNVFCHLHGNEIARPSGFYDRKTGRTFIKFSDWIPEYLQMTTQNALRVEMQNTRAPSDVEGYIYAFEILDPDEKNLINLKVGRATNLNRRMNQWGKQCGSKEQVLRGFWPGGMGREGVSMKGLVQTGPKGPWCHRLERLVHIELSDLAMFAPYLETGYPSIRAKMTNNGGNRDVKKCPDCFTMHKEIFAFKRATNGQYKDEEWERIVKPVIEKWGRFVEAYL
ncbi:hypothetical protein EDB83DRAFT_2493431 [Lactarius deliciosus]|nr:hypothetical protein EDB83DRAFT_2493431 [Lactarius deliciosus]